MDTAIIIVIVITAISYTLGFVTSTLFHNSTGAKGEFTYVEIPGEAPAIGVKFNTMVDDKTVKITLTKSRE